MKLTSESKFLVGILLATAAIVGVAILIFSKPAPTVTIPREALISTDAHWRGNENAPTYLVEFSDFQCPACAAFAPAVDSLMEKYRDGLLFVYRHYPLPQHQYAKAAAYAAEAAGLQGKFWEAIPILFASQNNFSDTYWETFAKTLGLNIETFKKDIHSSEIKEKVERDLTQAQALNLRSTPSFFLNGVLLVNLYGPDDLAKAVEKAISNK